MKDSEKYDRKRRMDDYCKVNSVQWNDISFFNESSAISRKSERRDLRFREEKVSKNANAGISVKFDWRKCSKDLESWTNIKLALEKEKQERSFQEPEKYAQKRGIKIESYTTKLAEEFKRKNKLKREDPWGSEETTQSNKEDAVKEISSNVSKGKIFSSEEQKTKTTDINSKISKLYKTHMSRKTKSLYCLKDFRRAVDPNIKTSDLSMKSSFELIIQVSSPDERIFKEFMVKNEALLQIRRKFPRLYSVVPDLDQGSKKLTYSAEAVILLIGHVFSYSFTFGRPTPPWRVILETFSMSKLLNIDRLQEMCKEYFIQNPVSPANTQEFCDIAKQLGVLGALEKFLMHIRNSSQDSPSKRTFQRACIVSISIFTEPSEFKLPLPLRSLPGKGAMDAAFLRDIKNELVVKAVSGNYCITGVQIQLFPTQEDFGSEVQIICEASNSCEDLSWEESRVKALNSMLIFNLKRNKLLLKAGQVASLSITIEDLKPRFCCTRREETYHHKTSCGVFSVSLKSNLKLPGSEEKWFFIEKLFYTTQ